MSKRSQRRNRHFVAQHHRAVWVVAVVVLAIVLVIVREHEMAKLTFAAIGEEFITLVADVVNDKLFNIAE